MSHPIHEVEQLKADALAIMEAAANDYEEGIQRDTELLAVMEAIAEIYETITEVA